MVRMSYNILLQVTYMRGDTTRYRMGSGNVLQTIFFPNNWTEVFLMKSHVNNCINSGTIICEEQVSKAGHIWTK